MERILLVSSFIPTSHENGSSIPISGLFEELTLMFEVDFLLIHESDTYFEKNIEYVKDKYNEILFVKKNAPGTCRIIIDELFFRKPKFLNYSYREEAVRSCFANKTYDLVWGGSLAAMSFVKYCIELGLLGQSKIGFSALDVTTYAYRNVKTKLYYSRFTDLKLVLNYFRSFGIENSEKKVMSLCDLVHVVTEREKEKIIRLLNNQSTKPEIVVAPNGAKPQLESVQISLDAKVLLFMSNLSTNANETRWFFKEVWPRVRRNSDAVVWMVGPPPQKDYTWLKDDRIIIKGFVNDLVEIFSVTRIFVLPIHHDIGYINRLADAMVAGLPIVTTSFPSRSFPELVNDHDMIIEDDAVNMADKIIELYHDDKLIIQLSKNIRLFSDRHILSWKNVADIMKNAFINLN